MADFEPLLLRRRDADAAVAVAVADLGEDKQDVVEAAKDNKITPPRPRVASLDVFRGLSVFVSIFTPKQFPFFPSYFCIMTPFDYFTTIPPVFSFFFCIFDFFSLY